MRERTALVWPELYFVRHGQTDWNAEGRYQGSRDIPLNAVGRGQADNNGALLRDLFARGGRRPDEFDWYVSPLGRTRETMERIRACFAGPLPEVTIDARLIELSFGIYEGRLHKELAEGAMAIAGERDASFWFFRPPAGESYDDLAQRLVDFGSGLQRRAVVVSHGGVLRVLRRLIEDFPAEEAVNWFPPQDSVVHFAEGRATVYPAGASWDD
ncbi:histidine phosphatase family protein [Devosia sp.]|uniref:histidine phosphatase family protein n=1 Tax=Devosia sp. TaxID=1871048 RepID=UPI002F10BE1B